METRITIVRAKRRYCRGGNQKFTTTGLRISNLATDGIISPMWVSELAQRFFGSWIRLMLVLMCVLICVSRGLTSGFAMHQYQLIIHEIKFITRTWEKGLKGENTVAKLS